jgi:hypothetical protein
MPYMSSNPTSGAENVSTDGSRFEVNLNSALLVPADAKSLELCVSQAAIWNTSPNIAASFGNNLFRYTTYTAPAGTYDIVILDGLWSLLGLGSYLSTQFVNNGHSAGLFTLSGLASTQKSVLTVATAGDSVDLASAPNAVGTLLGFTADVAAPTASFNAFSQEIASFNRNNSYTIQSNICNGSEPRDFGRYRRHSDHSFAGKPDQLRSEAADMDPLPRAPRHRPHATNFPAREPGPRAHANRGRALHVRRPAALDLAMAYKLIVRIDVFPASRLYIFIYGARLEKIAVAERWR